MKKIISLLLALAMMLSAIALVSCSHEDEKKTEGPAEFELASEEVKADDPNAKYDAEVKNLNGHEFHFITKYSTSTHLTTNEVYAEALNGETINDAVYKRNSALEKAYNITIKETNTLNPTSEYQAALTAGEYVCDVMFDTVYRCNPLSQSGLLVDLNSIENLNMNKIWWDQNYRTSMTFAGKCFFAAGDACTLDDRATWVLLFNKEILVDLDIDLPYQDVLEGKWTIDKMYDICKATTADLDGDNVITPGKDRIGYYGETFNAWVHALGGGATLSERDSDGNVYIPDTVNEKFLSAWAKIKPLMTGPYYYAGGNATALRKSRNTFFGINAGYLISMGQDSPVEFGVLPMPKVFEDQDHYYSTVSSSIFTAYCIPQTAEIAPDAVSNGFKDGIEQAGYLFEAFGYYSKDTLTVAFYDQVLMRQTAKDPESRKMIEMAFEYKIYDSLNTLRWGGMNTICNESTTPKDTMGTDAHWNEITSKYEAKVQPAREALNAYVDYLTSTL